MPTGLSPRFPLSLSEGGDFTVNETFKDLVKQNFKTLLLTIPGERIMLPDFGVGIQKYLFENMETGAISGIASAVNNQVSKYMPYISILDIATKNSEDDDHLSSVTITYYIKPLSEQDTIDVSVS
mgnify:CR=1 FL=1